MNTTSKSSGSVLPSVAKHEQELLARLGASKEEARNIVDQARADARKHLQSVEAALNEEVSRIRSEAEVARLKAFDATVQAADERLSDVRREAMSKVPEVAKSTLRLFMPSGNGGK